VRTRVSREDVGVGTLDTFKRCDPGNWENRRWFHDWSRIDREEYEKQGGRSPPFGHNSIKFYRRCERCGRLGMDGHVGEGGG
jgi:hypothetical protein